MTCPVCGTVAVPGARFCHNCGVALPAAATLPTTERRVVTVLFGDLSDFTSWSEDLDPERVGAVTDRVMAALAGAVKTFGGHVDKLTGDGIMAVFGAPVAHEDDAERAVRAALSMQRAVRRVLDDERGGGAPLGLRVGLNTGGHHTLTHDSTSAATLAQVYTWYSGRIAYLLDRLQATPDPSGQGSVLDHTLVIWGSELTGPTPPRDDVVAAARLSYMPGRSGDIVVIPKPYWMAQSTGTTHGTPYLYDQHVPVVFFGAGIRPGRYNVPAAPLDVAPTLAHLAGFTMPQATGRPLTVAVR